MNANIHAIGSNDFHINIRQTCGVPIIELSVDGVSINFFLHDGKAEQAFTDIQEAIRVFQMEQNGSDGDAFMDGEPQNAINGIDDSVRLDG